MIIHELHNSYNQHIMDLLKTEFSLIKNENLINNYHPDNHNDPANIFYILNDPRGRYSTNGCYYVLTQGEEYICSAGYNQYELDPSIALALTRAYISPKHRAKYYLGNYILPKIIKSTASYKHLYITANSHNDVIYKWFVRSSSNKRSALFNDWPEVYKKFKPIGEKIIYYKKQYVVEYEK